MSDLGSGEQSGRSVWARRDTSAAGDAGRGVHSPVRCFFRNQNGVAVRSASGGNRDITARSNDAIERAAIDGQIFDYRERTRTPGLEREFLSIFEVAHRQLANRCGGQRTVSNAVDHESAGTANSFTAVVLERDRVFALSRSAPR